MADKDPLVLLSQKVKLKLKERNKIARDAYRDRLSYKLWMWGNIYFSTSEGSCQGDPLKLETSIRSIDWLPDGQTLVFSTNEPGKIYFLDLNRGVGKKLLESFQNECAYVAKSTSNGE